MLIVRAKGGTNTFPRLFRRRNASWIAHLPVSMLFGFVAAEVAIDPGALRQW